ncbi:hypothetical protein BN1013_02334 [Candidatus Rubidus massiliensis]|nr:hypothetical protein BN1013_02334 [Candidatus Rubidus massiliensis]
MRHIKSERLKKLESELSDLEQWLKLGLVPKKDLDKHKEEIQAVREKIEEEKERLNFLKESGEIEEYVAPKRPSNRAGYTEMPTIPDIEVGETSLGETAFDMDTEASEMESTSSDEKDDGDEDNTSAEEDEEEESYFSDRNRWRRGGIIDPDADEW